MEAKTSPEITFINVSPTNNENVTSNSNLPLNNSYQSNQVNSKFDYPSLETIRSVPKYTWENKDPIVEVDKFHFESKAPIIEKPESISLDGVKNEINNVKAVPLTENVSKNYGSSAIISAGTVLGIGAIKNSDEKNSDDKNSEDNKGI